jgi:mannan endo-1,4-beta-mannosidase
LVSSYGAKTISGQTEFMDYNDLGNKTGLRDFNKVGEITGGKLPAIVAFDLMDYSNSRINCGAEPGTLSEDMINEHNEKNVILSPLWHWNAPTKLIDADCNGTDDTAWYAGFYTRGTTFDLKAALADTNGADYQALISDMDDIAAELKKFADADIPLLWRPLHEAEGGWFWWGAADAVSLKALWVLMYKRFTEVHQLNNLIWVYTHAGNLSNDWYPGNEYVDIVGYDGYDGNNADNPFKAQFSTLKDRFDGKKLVALTEVGTIPNIEIMHQQNAWWNFFITWSSEFSTEYGPQNADATKAKASYEFAGTVNLDGVPGGRVKVEAGLYEGFEFPVAGWSAQVSWTDGPGATVSSDWSAHALYSLSVTKDLSAETNPTNVVLQVYPTGGIDVTGNDKLSITVNTANAGTNSTAYVFVKHGDDWEWASTSAISANNATIEISVADYEWLAGVGVVFEGFDASSTAAKFYLDAVQLDNETLYDFEGTGQWEFQTNWSPASGLQLANDWKKSGEFSLAGRTQLQAGDDNIILQVYPTGGVLLGDVTNLKVSVHAKDTGNATQVQLFAKDKDLVWKDGGAVPLIDGSADLSLDVSTMGGELSGFGVRFMGAVNNATESTYYIDDVSFE